MMVGTLKYLDLLACPACHGTLAAEALDGVICSSCRRNYPVVDGIPVLIVEQAGKADGADGGRA